MKRKLNISILIIALLSIVACMRKDPVLPKEGEEVTWRGNSLLIIKAVLGHRREHVEKNLFYTLEHENFIGQFPINYAPKPFPTLTEIEAIALESAEEKGLKSINQPMLNDIEFNLMLNGSTVVPTDRDPVGGKVDHPDQVKVKISRYKLQTADFEFKRGELTKSYQSQLNTEQERELELIKRLDMDTKASKDGVDCYEYKERQYKEGAMRECFAKSVTPLVPDYHFYVPPGDKHNIVQVNRYVAGYTLYWFTNKKNIYRAQEIDAAIWRLLDAWNVSPYKAPALQ